MKPATLTKVRRTQNTTKRHPSQLDSKINVVTLIQARASPKFLYSSPAITWEIKGTNLFIMPSNFTWSKMLFVGYLLRPATLWQDIYFVHRILSQSQHAFVLIHFFLSNPRKQIATICPTKNGSFYWSFPLSQNSWSLGNILIVIVL